MWVGVTCLWLFQAGLTLQCCLCLHGAPRSCPIARTLQQSPRQLMWVGVTCLWLFQAGLTLQWCLCPHGAPGSCPVARTLQQPHPHRSLPSVLHVSSPKWLFCSKSKWGKPCPFGSAGRVTGPHSFGGNQLPHGFERGHLAC